MPQVTIQITCGLAAFPADFTLKRFALRRTVVLHNFVASLSTQAPTVRIQIIQCLEPGVTREAVEGLVRIPVIIVRIVLQLLLLSLLRGMISFTTFVSNMRLETILSFEPCRAILTLVLFSPFPLDLGVPLNSAHRLQMCVPRLSPLEGSTTAFA